jgi:type IV pilus assembly PilX-like protein
MTGCRDKGIALVTTLLVLLLMSTMIVGLSWLLMGDQKLAGNSSDRQLAFYGAESGLEVLTAGLENTFDSNYAPTAAAINGIVSAAPVNLVPGVQYLSIGSSTNGSGYSITFPTDANGNPQSSYHTIATGQNAGLVGLTTPYTLSAIAHTTNGSEVKLVRQVQTVSIPVFQFGYFSDSDLDFFAGPNFNFGGRAHTNGNLWLSEGNGNTLTMSNKVTAVGEVITSNLENGWPTSSNYNGVVNITTNPGSSSYADITAQTPYQSALGTTNWVGNVGAFDSTFTSMAGSVYNNIAVGPENTGVTALNMAIATPAIGGQPIDIIRRPVQGENTSNPAKLAERYYAQTSLRILLSDYGASGGCTDSDISSTSSSALPSLATNGSNPATPIDLATLAWTSTGPPAGNGNTTQPYSAPPSWIQSTGNAGVSIFPMPTSNAQGGANYTATDGYWVKRWYPIITGCIKIDAQSKTSPGTWTDVTAEILKLGWTGRNINPQVGYYGVSFPPASPWLEPSLSAEAAGVTAWSTIKQIAASGPTANSGVLQVGCTDPSPNAVIRLSRIRDNPSNAAGGSSTASNNYCGNNPSSNAWSNGANQTAKQCSGSSNVLRDCPTTLGTDYWPMALFDTREGVFRDAAPSTGQLTLAGTMYYVELDVANLEKWFAGTTGSSGTSANNTTGYSVYFSDRRGEKQDPNPPASVGTTSMLTGGYGYDDFVNPSSGSGCPSGVLDQGEDVESDYVSGVSQNGGTTPRTYGKTPAYDNAGSASVSTIANITIAAGPLGDNPSCSGNLATPLAVADQAQDLRENPALIFRRALKLVDGSTISTGTTCNGVACGLSVIAENPVYIQGDYNNPGLNTGFTGTGVAASVIADAISLLSDGWNDANSFAFPYNPNNRWATDTTYRLAVIGGKEVAFKQPSVGSPPQDFGTDGGAHNFLRYLEAWSSLYYQGSIVSMYYNHQAVGTFKCCTTVYYAPTRVFNFDSNFLTPSLLPPLTPMLRAINTLTFTQDLLPTQ